MIASNIDVAFIIQSCDYDFNLNRLERYLAMLRNGAVDPIILLSKSDLVSQTELQTLITAIEALKTDTKVLAYSAISEEGMTDMERLLKQGATYCLLGSSGVGKTTLINFLIGKEIYATKEVRKKDGKGKHTTARRQMIFLNNKAIFIDTPGIRELGNIDINFDIAEVFPEIATLAKECRFNDCTHTSEVGCAVLVSVKNGNLSQDRYQNYQKLIKEAEFHQMSYIEKRRKDKELGRFYRSVMKNQKLK
jgi:ribosome biogenesis GTPase